MIGPPPQDPVDAPPFEGTKPPSDAAEFRKALLGVPFPIEVDF